MAAVNQEAERIIKGMKRRSASRFRRLYGKRAKEVMYATANKLAQKEQVKMPPTYNEIFNENKSGDSSLRDWFTKSRASDGTPGWVQLGGKYAGKPCAKQPGQTTKPKCGSSKMAAALNSDEEERAFRRKNAEDPNPDRRGRAKNVATEETILERGDFWHPDPEKDKKLGGPGANQRAREDRASASKPKKDYSKTTKPGESYMDFAKRKKAEASKKSSVKYSPELQKRVDAAKAKKKGGILSRIARKVGLKNGYELEGNFVQEAAGEKDACYKKVKSRYKVWPSAYASGALVKCRKVGADNWGNKSEGLTFEAAMKCWKGCRRVPGTVAGTKGSCTCDSKNEEVTNESAAWTRKAGKNSEGGLNEKGRKSYEAENPGSDLKAPSKKVGNPRRASFCARMKGMKKKLTSKKTANDPDSRINKSLRAWNC